MPEIYDEPMCNCLGCQIKQLGDQVHHRLNGNAQNEDNLRDLIERVNQMTALDKPTMSIQRDVPNRYPGGKY